NRTPGANCYNTKTVIIAKVEIYRTLANPGEEELTGRCVLYCAVRVGALLLDRDLVDTDGGGAAVEEGMYLTNFAKKVTVIHRRDELRAQKILECRAFANEKMDFIWNNVVESFNEKNGKIGSVTLKNTETGDITEHETDGAFVYIG